MFDRLKAAFGFGRKKKELKAIEPKRFAQAAGRARAPEFEIPDMPENIDMDGMNRAVPPYNSRLASPGPRGAERSYPIEQPPAPVWTPSPVSQRVRMDPDPVSDYMPSHSSSGCSASEDRSSYSSSSSSHDSSSSHSSSYSSCSSDSGGSSGGDCGGGGGGGCD